MPIVDKYNERVDKINSLLCVGLDSDFEKLPEKFKQKEFPQFEFNKEIIEATHAETAAYKPNIAFYESRGAAGLQELKMTTEYLQANYPDIFLICDAKRGDTVATNEQYAIELFDYFGFDAITLNPYMGKETLEPFLSRKDKGCIILCRTSNPGAPEFQDLIVKEKPFDDASLDKTRDKQGKPLWRVVAERVRDEWNKNENCFLVVGAQYPSEMQTLRTLMEDMTFLVPGIGAQGAEVEMAVKAGLNSEKKGMIINSSRGIIFAENPLEEAVKLKEYINQFRKG